MITGIAYAVIFSGLLGLISWYDIKRGIIPNKFTYPAALAAILINVFLTGNWKACLLGGAVGLGASVLLWLMAYLSTRGNETETMTIGMGDVKLLILIGLIVGWPLVVAVILSGFIFAGLYGGIKAYYTRMKTGESFKSVAKTETAPLAPFLSLLSVAGLIIGMFI
jgi:prepilin signal peptidase PulO-like enzyme (type II secretory pathway)